MWLNTYNVSRTATIQTESAKAWSQFKEVYFEARNTMKLVAVSSTEWRTGNRTMPHFMLTLIVHSADVLHSQCLCSVSISVLQARRTLSQWQGVSVRSCLTAIFVLQRRDFGKYAIIVCSILSLSEQLSLSKNIIGNGQRLGSSDIIRNYIVLLGSCELKLLVTD